MYIIPPIIGRGVDINFSSTLFGNLGLRLVLFYYQDLQSHYNSTVRGVDFNDPQQAMADINRWVRSQTKGRLTNILDLPPAPSTKLVLANSMYFLGNWEFPFDPRTTQTRPFTISANDIIQVD